MESNLIYIFNSFSNRFFKLAISMQCSFNKCSHEPQVEEKQSLIPSLVIGNGCISETNSDIADPSPPIMECSSSTIKRYVQDAISVSWHFGKGLMQGILQTLKSRSSANSIAVFTIDPVANIVMRLEPLRTQIMFVEFNCNGPLCTSPRSLLPIRR